MSGEIVISITHEGRTRFTILPLQEMLQSYPIPETATTAIRIVSGYPDELFVDSRPPDLLKCSICMDTANDPVMCGNQHTFCRRCMSEWLRGANQSCPTCKVPVTAASLLKNRLAAEIIGQSKVRCLTAIPEDGAPPAAKKRKTAKKDICDWVGTTETLDRHMQECGYIQVVCLQSSWARNGQCPWRGRRGALAEHTAVCEYRKVACIFCNKKVPLPQMGEHKAGCNRRPVVCHNAGCNIQHAFGDTAGHRALCHREEIGCPYSATLGCGFTCAREGMPAHAGDASAHFAGLMTTLQASQATIQELQKENETMKEKLKTVDDNVDWTRAFIRCKDLVKDFGTFPRTYYQLEKYTISGCRWSVLVMAAGGNVWAFLELHEDWHCPFEITYHLSSTGGEGPKLDIDKTSAGIMGATENEVKWQDIVKLTTSTALDRCVTAGQTLHLHCFLKFKIPFK
ncbi:hypothetical protein B484DRAFT_459038 [Ochromonadaceae sp. CCMP2298]|nr:hypothetical protein B484DRAFT_459038 [Ochromonadaceae sp. CCMP2298]